MKIANHIKLRIGSSKKFVHVTNDHYVYSELKSHTDYLNVLKKITEISINNSCNGGFAYLREMNLFSRKEMSQLDQLKVLADLNYQYAVLWFEGAWPNGNFENVLSDAISQLNEPWLAAGNILSNNYPAWAHDCIVVNLSEISKIQHTHNIENSRRLEHTYIEKDNAFFATDKLQQTRINKKMFNWLIPTAFRHNLAIYKMPAAAISEYITCDPVDDLEYTKQWLLKDTSIDDNDEYNQLCNRIKPDKHNLLTLKQQKHNVLYITNTESAISYVPENIDVLIVPCSGINQWLLAQKSHDSLKRIVWFDNNPAQLAWMKLVIQEWNGYDYESFVNNNVNKVINMYNTDVTDYAVIFDVEMLMSGIKQMGGHKEFKKLFDVIKSAEHVFVDIDLTKNPDLTSYISSDDVVLLNATNIWSYESNWCNSNTLSPVINWLLLIEQLKSNSKKAYYKGHSCFHTMLDSVDMHNIIGNI